MTEHGTDRRKAIPEARDRRQSRALVGVVFPVLILMTVFVLTLPGPTGSLSKLIIRAASLSALFGLIVWRLRAGTVAAASCGAVICFLVIHSGALDSGGRVFSSGLTPLIALFALTFLATRLGRRRQGSRSGERPQERRQGRNVAQIVANLGVAGLAASANMLWPRGPFWPILLLAALCEATADTVSSEMGQAFGGSPILITTRKHAEPGTDGAVSLLGTQAGLVSAAIVALSGKFAMETSWSNAMIAFAGGTAGLLFDSLLGATVERRGWLGNDLVNFASTLFAALVSAALLLSFKPWSS